MKHVLILLLVFMCAACVKSPTIPAIQKLEPISVNYQEEGIASWYGGKFHGRKTASGEKFDKSDFTCAHRTLPFGTMLEVTNLDNGKMVNVRVTDRGPAIKSRLIDVSQAAAKVLEMIGTGTAHVRVMGYSTVSDEVDVE